MKNFSKRSLSVSNATDAAKTFFLTRNLNFAPSTDFFDVGDNKTSVPNLNAQKNSQNSVTNLNQ